MSGLSHHSNAINAARRLTIEITVFSGISYLTGSYRHWATSLFDLDFR